MLCLVLFSSADCPITQAPLHRSALSGGGREELRSVHGTRRLFCQVSYLTLDGPPPFKFPFTEELPANSGVHSNPSGDYGLFFCQDGQPLPGSTGKLGPKLCESE